MPPQDLDAEGAVLSAVMLEPEAMDRVSVILRPKHFYSEANRRIYEAELELSARGQPIDVVQIAGVLRDKDRLSQVGGSAYLAELVDAVPAVAHLETYARRVVEKWRARRIIAHAQELAARAAQNEASEELVRLARARLDDLDAVEPSTPGPAPALTPAAVIARWRGEGPLVRIPTGVGALDRLSRGGFPVPWRVFIVGAPSAGKTFIEAVIADHLARSAAESGACVGFLAVDEEPEDVTVRLAQMAGYTVAQAEARDPELLMQIEAALSQMRIRFYGGAYTIDAAAADVATWAKVEGARGALFVDSIQAARSSASEDASSPREEVEANIDAIRTAAEQHRLLVVATSEANRSSYRTEDAADTTNDLAAGAESRSIEFGAQTQLVLRTPKGHPDVVHVRVAKNRRADRGEFWLRLDRERHGVIECGNPAEDPSSIAASESERRSATQRGVLRDARAVASVVAKNPGIGEVELRGALRKAGTPLGVDRLTAAKQALFEGLDGQHLVNRGPHARACKWHLEPTKPE